MKEPLENQQEKHYNGEIMPNFTLNNITPSSTESLTSTNIDIDNKNNISTSNNELYKSEIVIITKEDNLAHPYFKEIIWTNDNYPSSPGSVNIIFPYSQQELEYWEKYKDTIVIHAQLSSKNQTIINYNYYNNQSSYTTIDQLSLPQERIDREKLGYNEISYKDEASRNQNNNYNYSFIGKVMRAIHENDNIYVIAEDIGWKFSQKVPKKFRESYISGQTLDNAFQAICEFMGIEFAYSIEDLSKLEFAEDGYSVKKDGEIIEDVPNIFDEFKKDKKEENNDDLNNPTNENVGLIQYDKSKKSNKSDKSSSDKDKSLVNSIINSNNDNSDNSNSQNDNTSVYEKIEKYQAEFDEKIKNLFIGNCMYNSDISSNIMNYSSITIPPSSGGTDDTSSNIEEITKEESDNNGNYEE